MSNESTIISKVWNFAHVLRDDGVGYGDYLEQITYLLFLKMAHELNQPPYNKGLSFPKVKDAEGDEIVDGESCDWQTLAGKRGAELETFYVQLSVVYPLKKESSGRSSPRAKTRFKTLPSF